MILGLAGAKRSGKNTVAKIIAEQFGGEYEVKEWSFAYKLKKSAAEALGITSDHIEFCDLIKETGHIKIELVDPNAGLVVYELSGREYLQNYGTEAHREIFGDNFWVDQTLNEIKNDLPGMLADEERLDIITDVRFPNEAQAILDSGGCVIRIRRPEVESDGDTHASEKPLPYEVVNTDLWNTGDLTELLGKTITLMDIILQIVDDEDS